MTPLQLVMQECPNFEHKGSTHLGARSCSVAQGKRCAYFEESILAATKFVKEPKRLENLKDAKSRYYKALNLRQPPAVDEALPLFDRGVAWDGGRKRS